MDYTPIGTCPGVGSGLVEIDQQLGGPIPWGSLVLIEGKHAAGKTVLCQHLTHSALDARTSVAFYTSETGSPSLLSQMASLGLDVMDHFLLDRLRIFPLELTDQYPDPDELLEVLLEHITAQPPQFQLVVLDSLTPFLVRCSRRALLNFVVECRQLCARGQTIALTLDSKASTESILPQIQPWCDIHLFLQMEAVMMEQVVKALRVLKTRRGKVGDAPAKVHFDVRPGLGIDVLWPKRSLP